MQLERPERAGRYLIRRMIDKQMLIEVDHLSQKARESVLAIAAARLPGRFQPYEHRRRMGARAAETPVCARQPASATPETAPALAAKIRRLRREGRGRRNIPAVALGTDTGGFAALPGPRADAGRHPLRYPFKSYDGRLTFARQRTGGRVYDINADGMAHYGLFADLIADMQRGGGEGRRCAALPLRGGLSADVGAGGPAAPAASGIAQPGAKSRDLGVTGAQRGRDDGRPWLGGRPGARGAHGAPHVGEREKSDETSGTHNRGAMERGRGEGRNGRRAPPRRPRGRWAGGLAPGARGRLPARGARADARPPGRRPTRWRRRSRR